MSEPNPSPQRRKDAEENAEKTKESESSLAGGVSSLLFSLRKPIAEWLILCLGWHKPLACASERKLGHGPSRFPIPFHHATVVASALRLPLRTLRLCVEL